MRDLDMRFVGGGLAALGALAATAFGYLQISTPECNQCNIDLAVCEERSKALTKAKDECKAALGGARPAPRPTPGGNP